MDDKIIFKHFLHNFLRFAKIYNITSFSSFFGSD